MEKGVLSRRELLQWFMMATVGTTLSACTPKVVERVVKETVPVEVQKVVQQTVVVERKVSEPVTLEFWNASWAFLVSEGMLKAYKESHPNVTVNQSDIGENVFGDQKFMTAVAAGTGPSIALQNRHTFMQFAAKGVYLDVTPYFEKSGLERGDWLPVQLEESTWQGRIYGLPIWTDTRYLFWNPEHYQDAGLDPSKPPATWDELEDFTGKLTMRNSKGEVERYGFVPYLFGNSWMWLYGFLNKAPAISSDKRTILCDDPRWVEALTWMVSFYDKYVGSFELANAFSDSVAAAGLGEPFVAGRVSMVAHGDFQVGGLLRSPDAKWDCAAMPI
ncbi:MAG: extracellular solute-binding protein, partial [Anaerolineae bacterium]|nr:extracellular solute-binding protein [Anaerolineae bacterium]